ncbi:hypothetical protein LL273_20010 [Marinobacter salarius]|jgi:hypothetical protein|uniref:Uncharacterized protein n=2 Tax=Marinobacter TaxID=2742 RepID=A0A5M3PTP2_9GAMM|nr:MULTISPECIES: hypothetical protein [Marinobacter]MBD3642238.1 hypothetical protein [Marinobacter sp.]HBW84499.1 hypothetical protein [Gammaproteobacteria bacterium]MCC4286009.1 hypothetical protein [Marinobacter salarius]PHQ23592.1 hypothetical protein CLH62_20125 [Marinobacter guineae]GBO86312.1 hypothetical protein MS5N3_37630 [Marinobacter salsuginis]
MLYTLGFMKCVIAPTFGMALWAWFVYDGTIMPELYMEDAAILGVFLAVPAALAFAVFCHYTRGVIRAAGVIAVAILTFWLTPSGLEAQTPEWEVMGRQIILPLPFMVVGTLFIGVCLWPVIYAREIYEIKGDVLRGVVQVALEDSNKKDLRNR